MHENDNVFTVDDVIEFIGKICSEWMVNFNGKTIAITGSNGKTSTTNILSKTLKKSSKTIGLGSKQYALFPNNNINPISLDRFWSISSQMEFECAIRTPNVLSNFCFWAGWKLSTDNGTHNTDNNNHYYY